MNFLDKIFGRKRNYDRLVNRIVQAYQDLDASLLTDVFSDDVVYSSVFIEEEIKGKDKVIHHLTQAFDRLKNAGIIYYPEIVDNENNTIIVLKDENTPNPSIILIEETLQHISKITMRPQFIWYLNDIVRPENKEIILRNITQKFHNWLEQEVSKLAFGMSRFRWIQSTPILFGPAIHHFSFRLGKSVFSVRLIVHGSVEDTNEYRTMQVENVNPQIHQAKSVEYDLIPCDLIIDINALQEPVLVHSGTNNQIDLMTCSSQGTGVLSDWEMNAIAVNQILCVLEQEGVQEVTFINELTFLPQIFYRKNGKDHYVYVVAVEQVADVQPVNLSVIEHLHDKIGEFAVVIFPSREVSTGGDKNEPLLFSKMSIEEAIRNYTGARGGAYTGI